ncbi:MAG: hypothetical protein ABI593_06850 [Betaproteobacteria bacterium]
MPIDHCVVAAHGPWLEQIDEVELIGGWAEVMLAAAFVAQADTRRYQVYLTSYDAVQVFVQNRTGRSFEIHAMPARVGMRKSAATCGYRVIAPRALALP